jgi:hypothetical protein
MKRFYAVSLVVLFSMSAYAQEKPSASEKQDRPPAAHRELEALPSSTRQA